MRILEIIHLRLVGASNRNLIEVIRTSIASMNDLLEARIYRNAKLDTDLAIHLSRQITGRNDQASDLGQRLAAAFREHGMVEHTIWIEEQIRVRRRDHVVP